MRPRMENSTTWYAVNDPRGLAPEGWHISTDFELSTLVSCLGGGLTAGGPMKEIGTTHWIDPNIDATNLSGFTGLPGGYRNDVGIFIDVGSFALFWSSTEVSTTNAWARYLSYINATVTRVNFDKHFGFSVRCIRD